ncbi:VirB2 family type IV secretion system major pilin TrwL [Bartonella raoultii]|uniref:VirB2 family type IV secretion system major pilin TrwL n=1 Tax=Bartonella raoultii TaxID=1457020 RepID=UPI001ABB4AFC|nr:VirB2 family type IV secretion system major pilin TrwL [Bartonella raoultii]
MKQLNIKSKINDKIIAISALISAFFITHPAYAALDKAKTALETLYNDIFQNIIPVAAAVILLGLAIGYAGRYIEKDTFIRWAVGVVVAGSTVQLVKMLFGSSGGLN